MEVSIAERRLLMLNKLLFLEMIFEIENNIQSQIIDKVINSLKFEK